jgi:hypothetical protein
MRPLAVASQAQANLIFVRPHRVGGVGRQRSWRNGSPGGLVHIEGARTAMNLLAPNCLGCRRFAAPFC